MDAFETRAVTPADAGAITDYHHRCFTTTYASQLLAGEFEAPDPASTRQELHDRFLPESDCDTQVAVVDDVPIGHVTVSGHLLVHLFVDPDHQKTGLGRYLLELGEAMIAADGHTDFELHARVENVSAIAFYERAGWTVTDRTIHTVEHGISYDERVLVKHHAQQSRRVHAGLMAASENLASLPLPDDKAWSSIGVVLGDELHGGHQSQMFTGAFGGEQVVVKLTDSRLVDQAYRRRVEMTSVLAEMDDSVVGPLTTDAGVVAELGQWLAVVYPFVVGRTPDIRDEADVRRMATAMANLHRTLQQLAPVDLPAVAALAAAEAPIDVAGIGRRQVLHGDFSSANLMFSERQARVFDFDDCGYGPIEFEVGNTLYMVLFDAAMSPEIERYERFRAWFVDEYRSTSNQSVPDELLDTSIGLRVQALSRWLDRPETAPIGIRTATPAWRNSLRSFVRSQDDR